MQKRKKFFLIKIIVLFFWLVLWQVCAMVVGKEVLVASPMAVWQALSNLATEGSFWYSIFLSLYRVMFGFILATIAGTLLAIATSFVPYTEEFIAPVLAIIKATPVASFIILTLLWIKSTNVPVFISFLMVLPIVWGNVSSGIKATDKKLLEMATVFNLGKLKTIKYVYIPECANYFYTACIMGIGFAWKSGIAAEVISTPRFSVGSNIYSAKIYLETADLFAWTIVVVVMSMVVEFIFKRAINKYILFRESGVKK